jgi:hypothetical protein
VLALVAASALSACSGGPSTSTAATAGKPSLGGVGGIERVRIETGPEGTGTTEPIRFQPAAGTVVIVSSSRPATIHRVRIGEDGRYLFRIAGGTYSLRFRPDACEGLDMFDAKFDVTILPGRITKNDALIRCLGP